ncbi:TolC family protein, partial [Massilia terrae]
MSRMLRAMQVALLPLAACAPLAHADTPLSLAQAVQRALAHNHDARLADIAVASADAAQVQAQAAPNPSLTVQTANINPAAGVGPGSLRSKTVDSTFRIDQLIERGGKRELRGVAAERLARAARSDAADTRRQLRRDVSLAYFDLLAAQERVVILDELAKLSDHTLDAAEKRQRAGDLAAADVARLRIDTLRARNDAEGAVADLAQARRALELLLGEDGGGIPVATDGWPSTAPATAVGAVDG